MKCKIVLIKKSKNNPYMFPITNSFELVSTYKISPPELMNYYYRLKKRILPAQRGTYASSPNHPQRA